MNISLIVHERKELNQNTNKLHFYLTYKGLNQKNKVLKTRQPRRPNNLSEDASGTSKSNASIIKT